MKECPENFGDKDEAGTIAFAGAAVHYLQNYFAGRANVDA
jgi:hypothetical protein